MVAAADLCARVTQLQLKERTTMNPASGSNTQQLQVHKESGGGGGSDVT